MCASCLKFSGVHTTYFDFSHLFCLQTALHKAAEYNESGIARILLQHGASQQIVDKYGMCEL